MGNNEKDFHTKDDDFCYDVLKRAGLLRFQFIDFTPNLKCDIFVDKYPSRIMQYQDE